jgi:hypothetical protein
VPLIWAVGCSSWAPFNPANEVAGDGSVGVPQEDGGQIASDDAFANPVDGGSTSPDGSAWPDASEPFDSGTMMAGSLPCDVDQLLQSRCRMCHSSPPQAAAPMSLVTYADLLHTSLTDPAKNEAQV